MEERFRFLSGKYSSTGEENIYRLRAVSKYL